MSKFKDKIIAPYLMWRGCGRKRLRYKHEGQARREGHKRSMRAYKCEYCGMWHLTSKKVNG